jgi:hypothetical protein
VEAAVRAVLVRERVDGERPDVADGRERGAGGKGELGELRVLRGLERGRREVDAEEAAARVREQRVRRVGGHGAAGVDPGAHASVDDALAPRLEDERAAPREQAGESRPLLGGGRAGAAAAVAAGGGPRRLAHPRPGEIDLVRGRDRPLPGQRGAAGLRHGEGEPAIVGGARGGIGPMHVGAGRRPDAHGGRSPRRRREQARGVDGGGGPHLDVGALGRERGEQGGVVADPARDGGRQRRAGPGGLAVEVGVDDERGHAACRSIWWWKWASACSNAPKTSSRLAPEARPRWMDSPIWKSSSTAS